MATFSTKRTIFESESTFSLEGGQLTRSQAGKTAEQIELSQVRRVRLSYQPLTTCARWVCSVEGPGGRLWIPSASFVGIGLATERRVEFHAFVEALHGAVAASGAANVAFVQGGAWSRAIALVLLICMGVLGVLLLFGLLGGLVSGGGFGAVAWVFLPAMSLLWAARMIWRVWRGNPRRTYDPHTLPADFAPI